MNDSVDLQNHSLAFKSTEKYQLEAKIWPNEVFMAAILDLCQKTNFTRLDFSRILVCYSRDLSDHKTIEKPSVAICGESFSILTGLLVLIQVVL